MAIQAQLYPDNFGFPLGGSQNWMDHTYGFNEFCFNLPQKQQQQQQLQNLQQKTQSPGFDNAVLLSKNNYHESMAFSQSIAAQIEKQRQDIDRYISLQNERLRLALEEQRKQLIAYLLRKYEVKTMVLLKQKDEQITKAMTRTMELEDFLRRMEIENQTWQRVAKENDAMVASLNNTIEQLKENARFTNGFEDAESCCDMITREEDREDQTGGNRGQGHEQENEEQRTRKMVCKSCNSRSSCVIFLPCRHLCSCNSCQAFLDSCPVCGLAKKSIIEALI